jgi:hypothetical protein
MDHNNPPLAFPSVSKTLKLAYEEERQKPQYVALESDPCLPLWIASAVKRNYPEAFDLENPADLMVWAFGPD